MRETRAEKMDRLERRGTRGRQAIAALGGVLTRGTEGVTSLVHALLVRGFRHGCTWIKSGFLSAFIRVQNTFVGSANSLHLIR